MSRSGTVPGTGRVSLRPPRPGWRGSRPTGCARRCSTSPGRPPSPASACRPSARSWAAWSSTSAGPGSAAAATGGRVRAGALGTVTSGSGARYAGFAPYVDALYRGYDTALGPHAHRGPGDGRRRRGRRPALRRAPRAATTASSSRSAPPSGPRPGARAPAVQSPTWRARTSPSCCTPAGCRPRSRSASRSPSATTTGATQPGRLWTQHRGGRLHRTGRSTCGRRPAPVRQHAPGAGAEGAIVSHMGLRIWERRAGRRTTATTSPRRRSRHRARPLPHQGANAPTRALTILPAAAPDSGRTP